MGVMLSATDSLNWLSGITGRSPQALTEALGANLRDPGDVRFLPYLSGERTPHNDAEIRGSFTGLGTGTTVEDLTQAVLEGVSLGLRDSFEALKDTDAKLDRLMAIGGGAASDYWLDLIATVLDVPLDLPKDSEFGAALGAARLGILAATDADPERVITPPKIGRTIEPNPSLTADFHTAYQSFCAAYPLIKSAQ